MDERFILVDKHLPEGGGGHMEPDDQGDWVRLSELAAARAENERLTKERNLSKKLLRSCIQGNNVLRKKAQKSIAERDQAVAAAYAAAADALQNVADNWDCGHNESRLCDCARDAEQWGFAADDIRALTPADAQDALEAYGRKKVREGMKRAAKISDSYGQGKQGMAASKAIVKAILAEMEKLK